MNSMTGYGSAVSSDNVLEVSVELRTVNSRFLDCTIKLAQELQKYEIPIRTLIKNTVSRGRVDCMVTVKNIVEQSDEVVVHWELVQQIYDTYEEKIAQDVSNLSVDLTSLITGLFTRKDFLEVKSKTTSFSDVEAILYKCVEEALENLVIMRKSEGKQLSKVLTIQLDQFASVLRSCKEQRKLIESDYNDRLLSKLEASLGDQFSKERVLTEVALIIDKGDIQEEIDRLESHVSAMERLLNNAEPVGREMDFLVQEMNREVNTIGSKSANIVLKNYVIQMKSNLEKMKEQIQNIE